MSSILSFVNHNKLGFINILLLPLSLIFFILSILRRWLYRVGIFKVNHSSVPVVVVGNVTVGGTGKTPIVIAIVNYFTSQNKKVGVVSRGYGGDYTQESLEVTHLSNPRECGDEPILIAQQYKCQCCCRKKKKQRS